MQLKEDKLKSNHVQVFVLKKILVLCCSMVSCDVVLIEYYGKEEKDPDERRKGEHRNGTNSFHAYATVYMYVKGQRYTLAITYVRNHEKMLDVVKRLNRYVVSYGVKPSFWLLDRGFYGVRFLKWFHQHNKGYIMPLPRTGRKIDNPKGPSGTNVYQAWKRSGKSHYTIKSNKDKMSITVKVAVCATKEKDKDLQIVCYAYYLAGNLYPKQIHDMYKQRFAIESSYRQMKEAKAKTATKSPTLRYMMVGISLILRNAWIFLHYHVLYEKHGRIRIINTQLFTFLTMLSWIEEVINTMFPIKEEITIADSSRLKCLHIDI